jgi:precorrin-3B methylase
MIVGLGPGPAEWMTPEAAHAIAAASDVVGYRPYLDRLALRPDQCTHASDNRVEMDRARLGHDFCAISLSDNLKPWGVIERRLRAAAEGDFVIALYNPASRARPTRIMQAFDLLRGMKASTTPVAFARAVGRAEETLKLMTLGDADASLADMATLVVIGSSETRLILRDGARPWMVTPRTYGVRR